jgi:hypothetical protein
MGPRNAYKDMLDNVVSPITCVNMNHQNQLEQKANGVMFATVSRDGCTDQSVHNRFLPSTTHFTSAISNYAPTHLI